RPTPTTRRRGDASSTSSATLERKHAGLDSAGLRATRARLPHRQRRESHRTRPRATGTRTHPAGPSAPQSAADVEQRRPPPISDRSTGNHTLCSGHFGTTLVRVKIHTMMRPTRLSPRLKAVVDALPLRPDSRVLEIGCGPGAAARAVAALLNTGHILAVDRSAAAISQARAAAHDEIAWGRMSVRQVAAEDFVLQPDEAPYDL